MEALQNINTDNNLLADIRQMIEAARSQVASTVNSAMTLMYWHIGNRINREVLGGERAAYGKQIVESLALKLSGEYGKGFDSKSLRRMMQFASVFPDLQIVAPLVRQLSWSHFLQVIPIEDDLARNFYLTMAADQRWSKRTLRAKIDSMLYERMAIAKQPDEVILHDLEELRNERKMSADLVFQDPYVLDFLGLHDDRCMTIIVQSETAQIVPMTSGQMPKILEKTVQTDIPVHIASSTLGRFSKRPLQNCQLFCQ